VKNAVMSKKLNEFSSKLSIPGFDVKVKNKHSCIVKSKDGRHKFSAKIEDNSIKIVGTMFDDPLGDVVGPFGRFTQDADDVITCLANSVKLLGGFSSNGFSAKIVGKELVLSHSSKPDYSLRMYLTDARKLTSSPYNSVYTLVRYCGPAYDEEANKKWMFDLGINSHRLVATDKDFDELTRELKDRVLSLGEPDPIIAQWVTQEIENALAPQGFTFTPNPKKDIVEFAHPTGVFGSLSFAPFTADLDYDIPPKYPHPHFPTDIEKPKVVLLTLDRPNYRKPYTTAFLAKESQEVIHAIQGFLAIALVHKESHAWRSDLLVPKLRYSKLLLVNTERPGNEAILEIKREKDKLVLKSAGEVLSYPLSNTPTVVDTKEITQAIVERAERHIQVRKNVAQVYREICNVWKSDILIPKLIGDKLQLVNTELDGNNSIILELTIECDKLVLKDKNNSYAISDNPVEIAQTIVGLAEKHVQEFIQETGYIQSKEIVQEVPKLDF
jgi:hypothetical protein